MPIYDFKCNKCETVKEVITTSVKDIIDTRCKCGGEFVKQLNGDFGFRLNGECWAKDGYSYEYTKTKAGGPKQPHVHGRKTIDKKLKAIRMKDKE